MDARPWQELETLADELDRDQLRLWAAEPIPRLRVLGGPPLAPSARLFKAVLGIAKAGEELVIVDTPPLADRRSREAAVLADRVLVVGYDDPLSLALLSTASIEDSWWVIASQCAAPLLGDNQVFRALPRDEASIAGAFAGREEVAGALGRAYDELAGLIEIDAS